MLMGPNTGLGHSSMVYMIESQIQYVLDALKQKQRHQWSTLEVRQDAQSRYNASIHAKLGDSVWQTGCKSWYVNENGKNTTLWPGFTWQFRQQTRRFDAAQYLVRAPESGVSESDRLWPFNGWQQGTCGQLSGVSKLRFGPFGQY